MTAWRWFVSLRCKVDTLRQIQGSLARVEIQLAVLEGQGTQMASKLDALKAEITRNGAVIDSAMLLINGLIKRLEDMEPTQAEIDALVADLKSEGDSLADAVAANTPGGEV
jgi:hypothetical protein